MHFLLLALLQEILLYLQYLNKTLHCHQKSCAWLSMQLVKMEHLAG